MRQKALEMQKAAQLDRIEAKVDLLLELAGYSQTIEALSEESVIEKSQEPAPAESGPEVQLEGEDSKPVKAGKKK